MCICPWQKPPEQENLIYHFKAMNIRKTEKERKTSARVRLCAPCEKLYDCPSRAVNGFCPAERAGREIFALLHRERKPETKEAGGIDGEHLILSKQVYLYKALEWKKSLQLATTDADSFCD